MLSTLATVIYLFCFKKKTVEILLYLSFKKGALNRRSSKDLLFLLSLQRYSDLFQAVEALLSSTLLTYLGFFQYYSIDYSILLALLISRTSNIEK